MSRFLTALVLVTSFASICVGRSDSAKAQVGDTRTGLSSGAFRGVTVGPIESSQQPGRGYGSPYTERLLDHLVQMHVNWVSVTPFGRIWSLQSSDIEMSFEAPFADNQEGIARFVEQAHARGIRVLLIPHLWVWNEVGWRGEIDPGSPEGWSRFHQAYTAFILSWADFAGRHHVDAFSIGVECKSWSGRFGPVWESMIDQVRQRFDGFLTYSANWDEAEYVLFWDLLDFIGINAFFPLSEVPFATYEQYEAGALRNRDYVRSVSERFSRPVIFVELGYTSRANAAFEPWLWPDHMSDVVLSEYEQSRALEASMAAFVTEPFFAGVFLWRYYANLDDVSQEAIWGFSPHGKIAEVMLERAFSSEFASDSWLSEQYPPLDSPFALGAWF